MKKFKGLYGREIQKFMEKFFKQTTPYVCIDEDGIWCDVLVYLPEDSNSLREYEVSGCTHYIIYPDSDDNEIGCCEKLTNQWEVKKSWGCSIFAPKKEKENQRRLWVNNTTNEEIYDYRPSLIATFYRLPDEIIKKCKCIGENCPYHNEIDIGTLEEGVHLFEVKSNGDSYSKLVQQIPQYTIFGDYVWLVLEDKKPPKWLPPFVGIIRYKNNNLIIEKNPKKLESSIALKTNPIKDTEDTVFSTEYSDVVLTYLKYWFVNSAFYKRYNRNIIPMESPKDIESFKELIKRKRVLNSWKGSSLYNEVIKNFVSHE